jgi:hypothetical protein
MIWIIIFPPKGPQVIVPPSPPDTVKIAIPYRLPDVKPNALPTTVYVYKRDTVLRDSVERRTIITGVRIRKNTLEVSKIDPLGNIFDDRYNMSVSELAQLNIDGTGDVNFKPKKQWLRKKLIPALAAGVALVGSAVMVVVLKSKQ